MKPTIEDALAAIETWGPYGEDINESMRFAMVLAEEVKRLRQALWSSERLRQLDGIRRIAGSTPSSAR